MSENIIWIILLLAALAALLLACRFSGKVAPFPQRNSDADRGPVAEDDDPRTELLSLNLRLRKAGLPAKWVTPCEHVIDQLMTLLPEVARVSDGSSDLHWTVNRIATNYLPVRCVGPFLDLPASARPEQAPAYVGSLAVLSEELQKVSELLRRRDNREFQIKSDFLKHRFSQG